MQKYLYLNKNEQKLFKKTVSDIKKINQDCFSTYLLKPKIKKNTTYHIIKEQINSNYYFSDEYQPFLEENPIRYIQPGNKFFELKKLQRGDYSPDFFLDLHGLTKKQAKLELSALLVACKRENVYCACVMHGYGKYILKKQTPLWLAQHPDILAFHQAPKIWGGNAAILLLVKLTT
ncbi:UPF0115 protein YfcN [Serratia symbiotica]|nr:UPF0115 protein YfcN [Serratia symbiotica]